MESKQATPVKLGVLLYTFNRVDDARINLEIIRNTWKRIPLLREVTVVHAFNGKTEWWPDMYLEDELCRTDNPGHFAGAELLLNSGMEVFTDKYPDVTHVLILAADTWCVRPEYIERIVQEMRTSGAYLATSAWGNAEDTDMFKIGMSLDFSMLDMNFVRKSHLFPLRYQDFVEKYSELLSYQGSTVFLERLFALRFKQAVTELELIPSENLTEKIAQAHIYRLLEREPVHYKSKKLFEKPKGKRTMHWPRLGLITHHDPKEKQRALRPYNVSLGEHGKKFLAARDLNYFNSGLTKTVYKKGEQVIDYND